MTQSEAPSPAEPVRAHGRAAPEPVAGLVSRARLFALLDAGATAPVTLVCGPAGSGKSTLVASWLTAAPAGPSAWVQVDGAIPIVAYVPMMMFAILFGLAMDYQVFLLSRVREEIDAGKSTRRAVVDGLAGTGKVIASAAAIMVSVLAGFVLNGDPTVKEFGVGLASAILIAGSMVCVLLPAAMLLMGERSWWLPRRLDRLLPDISVEGPKATPEPAPQPA